MTSSVLVPEELASNKTDKSSHLVDFIFQLKETIVKEKVFLITSSDNGYEDNKAGHCNRGRWSAFVWARPFRRDRVADT